MFHFHNILLTKVNIRALLVSRHINSKTKRKRMAYIDLGSPSEELVISGGGAGFLAEQIGGVSTGLSSEEYEAWYQETRCYQISELCGALAMQECQSEDQLVDGSDFGRLVAAHAGSGSI